MLSKRGSRSVVTFRTVSFHYFLLLAITIKTGESSRITITNGVYNDILVAIHPETQVNDCVSFIQNIIDAFEHTSSQLNRATNGRLSFGSIKLLIPPTWGNGLEQCGTIPAENVTIAQLFHLYENADLKLTSKHPFAKKLPWTNQYKGCENESDSIFVPVELFQTMDFDSATRGRIILAEWAKFRYGVFEEHGYFTDPRFPSCYSHGGKAFYTGCTSDSLNPISNSTTGQVTPETCDDLLRQNAEFLNTQLQTNSASLLLAPYLNNMEYFCTKEYQIGLSPTKHNVLCDRRSVADIVFSHNDFTLNSLIDNDVFPKTRRRPPPGSSGRATPQITLIRRDENFDQGYAFVIEDGITMRDFARVVHVKQAVAQMLQLMKPRTNVAILKQEGAIYSEFFRRIVDDFDRNVILSKIPEPGTPTLSDYITARFGKARTNHIQFSNTQIKKKKSFMGILNHLANHQFDQWHIVMISSSPPGDLLDTLQDLQNSSHDLSVITFDESKDWLAFNKIPNTKKVVFVPTCVDNPGHCYGRTSSLLVDYFTEILATNSTTLRHFTHKLVDFTFSEEVATTFTLGGEGFIENLANFQLFLPTYTVDAVVNLYSPSGRLCNHSKLLDYDYVLKFDTSSQTGTGCPYETGTWRIEVRAEGTEEGMMYTLYGVGETVQNSANELILAGALGKATYSEIFPTTSSLPVFVKVSTTAEEPVINAEVSLRIFHERSHVGNVSIPLMDNGVDPDIVANDGVYSAFVTGFSLQASFHTGQVTIRTFRGTSKKIVTLNGISESGPALLDSRMNSKCCGSVIPIETTADVGTASYSLLLPSFRTGENIDDGADIFPPSRIQSVIQILEESVDSLVLEFIAPGSDYSAGTVSRYEICCTNSSSGNLDDSFCTSVLDLEGVPCNPVTAQTIQNCEVSKQTLTSGYFNNTSSGPARNGSISTLFCALRGVDDVGNLGPLSFSLIEIDPEFRNVDSLTEECKQISDGCLPVDVFWALIGCIGGLVLILFVVIICWCCVTRQEQKAQKQKQKKQKPENSNWIEGIGNDSMNNTYVNQGYIQDSNRQLRLVNGNGSMHSLDNSNGNGPEFSRVRRRSMSVTDLDTGEEDKKGRKHVSWNGERNTEDRKSPGMIVIARNFEDGTSKGSFSPPAPLAVHSSSRIRPSATTESTLQIPRLRNENTERDIPSISADVDAAGEIGPVYASVSRIGRKPYSPNTIQNSKPYQTYFQERGAVPSSYTTSATHQVNPKNYEILTESQHPLESMPTTMSPSQPGSVSTSRIRAVLPPVRLDHFPSSESEVYSDMSQIIKNPKQQSKGQFTNFTRPDVNRKGMNPEVKSPIRPVSSPEGMHEMTTLPNKNTESTIPQIHKSMEIQRPRSFPPPPPPRTPSQHNVELNNQRDHNKQVSHSPVRHTSSGHLDSDSDNSDNWDDYAYQDTNFKLQYNPGTSSA